MLEPVVKRLLAKPVLRRFMEKSPLPVMARAVLERLLGPVWVDEVFDATTTDHQSGGQYTRKLLFSTVFALMVQVVLGQAKTVRKSYRRLQDRIPVSLTSVYNKLNGVSPATAAALVRESGRVCARTIAAMDGQRGPLLPGYAVRILDGNCLAATDHRIEELRALGAGALPGKSLVVYDAEAGCVQDVVPCEDGHTQERALLTHVLPLVRPGEVWIADRNFCTRGFILGVVRERQAHVLLRQHENLPLIEQGKERAAGTTATGEAFEQRVKLVSEDGQSELILRRVTVRLKRRTRDGDRVLRLITDLPDSVDARTVAELYRQRWRVETAFQELERDLQSEIRTLGYPRAALFGFCVALVAYNVMALVYGALRAEHGSEKIDEGFSHYYLADELETTHRGMTIIIEESEWRVFSKMSDEEFIAVLLFLASKADLAFFAKSPKQKKRGPRTKKVHDSAQPHVATARLLAKRKRSH